MASPDAQDMKPLTQAQTGGQECPIDYHLMAGYLDAHKKNPGNIPGESGRDALGEVWLGKGKGSYCGSPACSVLYCPGQPRYQQGIC